MPKLSIDMEEWAENPDHYHRAVIANWAREVKVFEQKVAAAQWFHIEAMKFGGTQHEYWEQLIERHQHAMDDQEAESDG